MLASTEGSALRSGPEDRPKSTRYSGGVDIQYDNRFEDLLTLNQYLSTQEGRLRRNRRIGVYGVGFLLLGGAVGWGAAPWATAWPLFVFLGAMAAVALIVGPWLERRSIRAAVERSWEEDQHLGQQEISFSDLGVRHRSERGEIERSWDQVSGVVVEGDVLLLLLGESAAHVVPRRVFASDQIFRDLALRAQELWEEAGGR